MSREQFNCRIPMATKAQMVAIAERFDLSQSEVLILALDRLSQSLRTDPAYQRAEKKIRSCSSVSD